MAGARSPPRRHPRPPPARPVRRRPRRAERLTAEAAGLFLDYSRTGSRTRPSRCSWRWRGPRRVEERRDAHVRAASRSTSPRTGPSCTSRSAAPRGRRARGRRPGRRAGRARGARPDGATSRGGSAPASGRVHRQADPQRRQHRHRRLRPRPGDGHRGAAPLRRPVDCASASSPTSTATDISEATRDLDPAETLFIVASKTFTTLETHDQRPDGAGVAGRRRSGDEAAVAQALRRRLDQRREGARVRHRHREHVRVLGLGRRPLLVGRRSGCR